jgi:hypothetical protein
MGKVHRIRESGSASGPLVRRINGEISNDQYVKSIDDRVRARRASDAREISRAKKSR